MTQRASGSATMEVRQERTASSDGTTIGWFSIGQGPDLVIVHGAMQSAHSQLDLARLLAQDHTVHLVDRRGRGLSGPYPPSDHYTPVEVADLATVLHVTGAHDVLGVSSGALLALRAALSVPTVRRVAAFEPPLLADDQARLDQIARFQRELADGDLPNAMVTAMITSEMGPPWMFRMPRGVLRLMSRRILTATPRPGVLPGAPTVRELLAALKVDFAIVAENAGRVDDFRALTTAILLLTGSSTRPYLQDAVHALHRAIPGSQRVALAGTGHGVTQNRSERGRPDRVAPALSGFFQ